VGSTSPSRQPFEFRATHWPAKRSWGSLRRLGRSEIVMMLFLNFDGVLHLVDLQQSARSMPEATAQITRVARRRLNPPACQSLHGVPEPNLDGYGCRRCVRGSSAHPRPCRRQISETPSPNRVPCRARRRIGELTSHTRPPSFFDAGTQGAANSILTNDEIAAPAVIFLVIHTRRHPKHYTAKRQTCVIAISSDITTIPTNKR
jgi:hypothetical protein